MAEWKQVKEIVGDALETAPENRASFLDEACADDKSLRREVESLLAASENDSLFMEEAAVGKVAEMFDDAKSSGQISGSFNHYKIIKQIGAGGMGEVYLAEDTKLDRKVAVKVLNQKFAAHESNIQRFVKEAKAASSLNHPNILVIHEIGESEGAQYIVSEYVEGKTLRQIIKENTLSLAEILDISIQIANALNAAHSAHIIHRDIKPENVIIRPDGLAKILDFGLAKLIAQKHQSLIGLEDGTLKQNETAKGIILGTVNYMSPEQAKGEKVDERTDIFSLGAVIYEMIGGKTPFAANSMSETFANLINKEPIPLSHLVPDMPKELERIVLKTLVKNKTERYQSMKDLLADLKEFRENLTLEKKLDRSHTFQEENKTVALPTKTDDLNEQTKLTKQFSQRILTRRSLIYGSVLLILLAVFSTFLWHWRQNSTAVQPPEIKSLAVLPLKSLDNGENYLGLGIADAVIRRISQTGKLTVNPTSAVRHYLNEDTDALTAAKQLNADAVLEGSVQKADNRLRISVNLLRTGDGVSVWADSFDLTATDIFTIQDKVSEQLVSRLQIHLNPDQQAGFNKRSTSNSVAYDYYLRGIYALEERGYGSNAKPQMDATIDSFKKAIEADPNYALAHAKLGYAYVWTAIFIEKEQVWADRAVEEINRAQELDPQLAETHIARSLLLLSAYRNWQIEAAAQELISAQQLNPNVGHTDLGAVYFHIGLDDLTERELQRALEFDPTSNDVKSTLLESYLNLNKYDEWFAACQKYTPDKCSNSAWYLMGKGRLDEAQKILDAAAVNPQNPNSYRQVQQNRAKLLALKGDFSAAEAIIPDIVNKFSINEFGYHHMTYNVACIYALAGKTDEAVKWLRETADKGFPCYSLFQRDQYLDRIRQSPEFVKFMEEQKAQNEKFKSEFQ